MGQTTISWTATRLPTGAWEPGYTFQAWEGCQKVSEGCDHCYAESRDLRYHRGRHWGRKASTPRKPMSEAYWRQPAAWNRKAERLGTPLKVFCASLADVFEDHPDVGPWRARLWRMVEDTPWLVWMLLTKRAANIRRLVPPAWLAAWPARVWIGTSVETQVWARIRIPLVRKVPAALFLSVEPLLGPVTLPLEGIGWVIVGGESGPGFRPMALPWLEAVVAACQTAGVPIWVKQDSHQREGQQGRIPDHLWIHAHPRPRLTG
jgi:protein gp37